MKVFVQGSAGTSRADIETAMFAAGMLYRGSHDTVDGGEYVEGELKDGADFAAFESSVRQALGNRVVGVGSATKTEWSTEGGF